MDRYQRRVRRGAMMLDRRALYDDPSLVNWRSRIDLETLDLSHEGKCILGQLYGNFFKAPGVYAEHTWTNMTHGFTAPFYVWDFFQGYERRYEERIERLTKAWQEYITATRRKIDKVPM